MLQTARGIAALLVVASATASGCASADVPAQNPGAAVRRADSAWAAAAAAGNLEASVAALAPDGIMFPPGAPPIVGRAAARQFMQEAMALPGFSVTWQSDTVVVATSGDLAYAIGRSRYTFPDSAGGLDTLHAKAVSVWRRDADGQWRAVLDIWNEAPPGGPILPVGGR